MLTGGGYLSKILDAIVDAIPESGGNNPLIIEGEIDGQDFKPNEGQPTLQEAISAYMSGRPVYANYEGANGATWALFTYASNGGKELYFINDDDPSQLIGFV